MNEGKWVERPQEWTAFACDPRARTLLRCPKCGAEKVVMWSECKGWYWEEEHKCGRRCKYARLEWVRDEYLSGT